jgi:hypothetical protein
MSILDISIVNVAMASMSKDFGTSAEDMQWISTAYSLTEGVVVPVSAWLGARFGLKRVYIWALILFTVGSVLCGLAGGLGSLIGCRVLQAIPGGVIPVVCLTILYRIVPKEKIGRAVLALPTGAGQRPGARLQQRVHHCRDRRVCWSCVGVAPTVRAPRHRFGERCYPLARTFCNGRNTTQRIAQYMKIPSHAPAATRATWYCTPAASSHELTPTRIAKLTATTPT